MKKLTLKARVDNLVTRLQYRMKACRFEKDFITGRCFICVADKKAIDDLHREKP